MDPHKVNRWYFDRNSADQKVVVGFTESEEKKNKEQIDQVENSKHHSTHSHFEDRDTEVKRLKQPAH